MSNGISDRLYDMTANEPVVHTLIRKSPVFVHSAGMRVAPEILLIELFREVFFTTHYGAIAGKDLQPNEKLEEGSFFYSTNERAVLYALRGRRRKSSGMKAKPFFAPAYPSLARNAWLRKNSERVIYNLLFGGAVAQYLWLNGKTEAKKQEQEELATRLFSALIGQNSVEGQDVHGKDILSVTLQSSSHFNGEVVAKTNIIEKTVRFRQDGSDMVFDIAEDVLSTQANIFKQS